ncbi:hypothetical protein CDQ91_20820 [Sphingopyxis witflariensis]|uniref:Uncharacterized protein n=2 Tax=Sphingopyxis witflariensis TaxID=173675 RepID=A0A246J512_9SPHN|nr:hypothetical protein CDQ91_20820 [Sphingopyxis witflariensis]
MMSIFLHDIFGENDGESVRLGLPAGAVHLKDRKLIIAGTVCDPPMFRDVIKQAAISADADVLVAHHGFYPETLNQVFFSLLVHIDGAAYHFERMRLYFHPADGYWLVPDDAGLFVALEEDVICPLLSGPKLMIFWITKEIMNAEQEASPGRDYWQAA